MKGTPVDGTMTKHGRVRVARVGAKINNAREYRGTSDFKNYFISLVGTL
jgi:hypothetical protein